MRMKNWIIIAFLLTAVVGFSQHQGMLRGTVIDQEMHGEPLLFAHVQLKGTDTRTETNFHGNFEFSGLEDGDYIVIVSYAGYETLEMPVSIKSDEITQVDLGMAAKRISWEGVVGLNAQVKKGESTTVTADLQKE